MARGYSIVVLVAVMANALPVHAAPQCAPTIKVATQHYPGAASIPTSNNLMLPAGKSAEADGQKFILAGRLIDKNCMPVANAVVELWQNDPFGKWMLAQGRDLATPNAVFAGAGRTYTDANGQFNFISAFPAPIGKRAPFVNLRILADGFKEATTALFFSDDVRNPTDEVYKKLSATAQQDVTLSMQSDEEGNLIGSTVIVLPGTAPYRTY